MMDKHNVILDKKVIGGEKKREVRIRESERNVKQGDSEGKRKRIKVEGSKILRVKRNDNMEKS